MIVVDDDGALLLIEQEAHAHLTGDLAALMPRGGANQAAFVAAARVHDNGWREPDAAPTVDEDGRPHTFTTIGDDAYEAVWRRGIERAAGVDAYVGLLVGLHGARFFGSRRSDGMQQLFAEERERQGQVLAALDLGGTGEEPPAGVAEDSDRVAMLDALSLMLCGAIPQAIIASAAGTRYTLTPVERGVVRVRPWPFVVESAGLGVVARRLPAGPYETDTELRAAVAVSDLEPMTVVVA